MYFLKFSTITPEFVQANCKSTWWSFFSWILFLFYQKSSVPSVKRKDCMSVRLWLCILQWFCCNFRVYMSVGRHGFHLSASFCEEFVAAGVCCHHHWRYLNTSSSANDHMQYMHPTHFDNEAGSSSTTTTATITMTQPTK